jgi:membrane-associated HD superfamily phosphohydrolase
MISFAQLSESDFKYLCTLREVLNEQRVSDGKPLIPETEFYDILDSSIGNVFRAKNINEESIHLFFREFKEKIEEGTVQSMITHIVAPPLDVEDYLNRIIDINEISTEKNISNKNNWLGRFKFVTNPTSGSYEALITLFFKGMSASKRGDIDYTVDGITRLLEVKGENSRPKGQYGYKNGMGAHVTSLLKTYGFTPAKHVTTYNFKGDFVKNYESGIKEVEREIELKILDHKKEITARTEKLEKDYEKRNKDTKGYRDKVESIIKSEKKGPGLKEFKNKIKTIQSQKEKNCFLENVSIELAKVGRELNIKFFRDIFSTKYELSDKFDPYQIERLVKIIINEDGHFAENFYEEYLLFEVQYYQQLENWSIICLCNNAGKMLFIDSLEVFRKFVYDGTITMTAKPSFSPKSGSQGEVFSMLLSAYTNFGSGLIQINAGETGLEFIQDT